VKNPTLCNGGENLLCAIKNRFEDRDGSQFGKFKWEIFLVELGGRSYDLEKA